MNQTEKEIAILKRTKELAIDEIKYRDTQIEKQKTIIRAMKEQIEDISHSEYRTQLKFQLLKHTLLKQKQELQTLNRVIQKRNRRIGKLVKQIGLLEIYSEEQHKVITEKNSMNETHRQNKIYVMKQYEDQILDLRKQINTMSHEVKLYRESQVESPEAS